MRDSHRKTAQARSDRSRALENLHRTQAQHENAQDGTPEESARAALELRNANLAYEVAHAELQDLREVAKELKEELAAARGEGKQLAVSPGVSTSSEDLVLVASHVSKKFSESLRQSLRRGLRDLSRLSVGRSLNLGELRKGEFWAVDDVSLELRRGESVGILGANGSGKTTLSRILAGVFPPDLGEVTIYGRMTSILTVGAGFHPHLNGLENIRLNGAVLGLTEEEVDDLTPGILDFAGLGERVHKPVGMYSSGMRMRLGFAVVTATRPDVMIFDEVLAVGDLDFRHKCIDRLGELRDTSALVMVAQSPNMVETFCSQALWLHHGRFIDFGAIEDIGPRFVLAQSSDPESDFDEPIDLR